MVAMERASGPHRELSAHVVQLKFSARPRFHACLLRHCSTWQLSVHRYCHAIWYI